MAEATIAPTLLSQTSIDIRLTKQMSFKLEQLGTCKYYNKEDPNKESRSYVACFQKEFSEYLIGDRKINCTSLLSETYLPQEETRLPNCVKKEQISGT